MEADWSSIASHSHVQLRQIDDRSSRQTPLQRRALQHTSSATPRLRSSSSHPPTSSTDEYSSGRSLHQLPPSFRRPPSLLSYSLTHPFDSVHGWRLHDHAGESPGLRMSAPCRHASLRCVPRVASPCLTHYSLGVIAPPASSGSCPAPRSGRCALRLISTNDQRMQLKT